MIDGMNILNVFLFRLGYLKFSLDYLCIVYFNFIQVKVNSMEPAIVCRSSVNNPILPSRGRFQSQFFVFEQQVKLKSYVLIRLFSCNSNCKFMTINRISKSICYITVLLKFISN